MTIIVTIKSIQNGFFKVHIKRPFADSHYREFTAEVLYEYLQAVDFYCETKGYQYKFIVPDAIKKVATSFLEAWAKTNNKSDVDA